MGIIKTIYFLIRAFPLPRLLFAAENLALRQQVAVYQHTVKRSKLRKRERIFWVWLARLWSNWRSVLAIVPPETVIQWHPHLGRIRTVKDLSVPCGVKCSIM
jgi:hypothetical protein